VAGVRLFFVSWVMTSWRACSKVNMNGLSYSEMIEAERVEVTDTRKN
jgi:hypothetical protein